MKNTVENEAKKLYDMYVINNKSYIAVYPSWSLLPDHAKNLWIAKVKKEV